MGYFRHKIDRGRCAAQKQVLWGRPAPAELRRWASHPEPLRRLRETAYFRLTTDELDPDSRRSVGIFQAASNLRYAGPMSMTDLCELRDAMRWFNRRLNSPRSVPPLAIFWFKSGAAECRRRIARLVRLLQAHDQTVHLLTTNTPGRIVYQDDQQIAAIPFADRFVDASTVLACEFGAGEGWSTADTSPDSRTTA